MSEIQQQQKQQIKCKECGKNFKHHSSYSRHLNQDHRYLTIKCRLCNRIFQRADTIKRHLKLVHSKNDNEIQELLKQHSLENQTNEATSIKINPNAIDEYKQEISRLHKEQKELQEKYNNDIALLNLRHFNEEKIRCHRSCYKCGG
jgi:uncharacterized C2H2 Zn-finger protein